MNKATTKLVSIYIFIDGFGWEVYQYHPWFMKKQLSYSQPVRSVLGYSNACIPTILHGVRPDQHLHWSSFFYAPESSPFKKMWYLELLPAVFRRVSRVKRFLIAQIKCKAGLVGYFDLYDIPASKLRQLDYFEKHDIFEPRYTNGHPNIFEVWREKGVQYLCLSEGSDDQKMAALLEGISASTIPEKIYVHLNRLDSVLHQKPKTSEDVEQCLESYAAGLKRVTDLLEARKIQFDMRLFSDHGMCEVKETVDLRPFLERSGLSTPADYFCFQDATMARFWVNQAGVSEKLFQALESVNCGRFLSNEERADYGLDPDVLDFYGDEIFLLEPGVVFAPNDLSRKPPFGMHGYDPEHEDSFALLLATHKPAREVVGIEDLMAEEWE